MNTHSTIPSESAPPVPGGSKLFREAAQGVNSLAQDLPLSAQSRLRTELPFTYTYYGFGGDPRNEAPQSQ